jgi:uncharacterized protein YbjT (DUF2867 family)
MKSPFVICGSTGNVGSRIAETLLAAGKTVRVIGRERVRLGPLASKGAEPWPGDIGDGPFLAKAFAGARAVFSMIPPKYDALDFRGYQARIAETLSSALSRARVPRVVALSSIGAHLAGGTGPIQGLHDFETMLDALQDAAVVKLRAAYFMENHLWSISAIRAGGIMGSPVRPDIPIPMVATRDIADAASRLLLEGTFTGYGVRYLLGPGDLTMTEAARILGGAIGKPELRYVQLPEEEARNALAGAGISGSAIDAMLEMDRALNAGRIRPSRERNAESTTPTTLDEFAKNVFAAAYRAAA